MQNTTSHMLIELLSGKLQDVSCMGAKEPRERFRPLTTTMRVLEAIFETLICLNQKTAGCHRQESTFVGRRNVFDRCDVSVPKPMQDESSQRLPRILIVLLYQSLNLTDREFTRALAKNDVLRLHSSPLKARSEDGGERGVEFSGGAMSIHQCSLGLTENIVKRRAHKILQFFFHSSKLFSKSRNSFFGFT